MGSQPPSTGSPEQEAATDSVANAKKRIALFVILTFELSAVFYALIISAGTTRAGEGLCILGLMWCPGAAAIVTSLLVDRNLKALGWRVGSWTYLAVAYVLPLFYAGAPYLVVWATGLGVLDPGGLPGSQAPGPFVAVATTVGFAQALLSAAGEEIGWRGLLVPQLARVTRFRWVAILSGLIWAAWHYPLILFADYHGDTPSLYSLACFTTMVVGISFALAWLRLESGSLWPAAVMHASHNLFIQGIFDPLTRDAGLTEYFTGEFGLALALAAVGVAMVFAQLWRGKLPAVRAALTH